MDRRPVPNWLSTSVRCRLCAGSGVDPFPPVEILRTSGGLFWDSATHDFDAARFLVGDEVAVVHAVGVVEVESALASFDDVDYGIVSLRFRGRALAVVQASWRAPNGYDIRAEVHRPRGKVMTEVDEKAPTRLYDDLGRVIQRNDQFAERFREAFLAELQAFVDALRTGSTPSPGAKDGARALQSSGAATRSQRSGEWVAVGDP